MCIESRGVNTHCMMAMHVQGALMLSEVLREREAQINYKKRKQELLKDQDTKYLRKQQEVCGYSSLDIMHVMVHIIIVVLGS